MAFWARLKFWKSGPEHLARGKLGERAAEEFLRKKGYKYLTSNFASKRGEIDLIFRDANCLVFVEVKTRSSEAWSRPSAAVNRSKKQKMARTATTYIRMLSDQQVAYRFDIVEVLLSDGKINEIRHIENSFNTEGLWRRQR